MGHDVTVLTVPKDRLPFTAGRPMPTTVKVVELGLPELFYRIRRLHKEHIQLRGSSASCDRPTPIRRIVRWLDDYRLRVGIFATCRMPDLSDLWIRPATQWCRKAGQWDLAVSSAGPYSTHLIAADLRRQGLTRFWIADYRDLWVNSPTCTGLFPFTLAEKRLERRAMKHADLITTVSAPLAHILSENYGHKKVRIVENGYDQQDLADIPEDPIFPQDGKVRIVYTGAIYKGRRDPAPLFSAISKLAVDGSTRHLLDRLEVIFYGSMTHVLAKSVKEHKIDPWVRLLGTVPRSDALRIQRDAHALLFLEWDEGDVDGIVSGKLFEYMSSGTPIWGVGVTEKTSTGKLIRDTGTGILFGVDVAGIASELVGLLTSCKKEPAHPEPDVLARFERRTLAERLLVLASEQISSAPLISEWAPEN